VSKRKRRSKAECDAVKAAAVEILAAAASPMSLRAVHYRLVSRENVNHPNTQAAYGKLSEWLRDMRLDGTIPWRSISDSLRGVRGRTGWASPREWAEAARHTYRRDVWQDQPRYVEVWIEKDALAPAVREACARYRVPYNVGRGYDGWTSIRKAASRYIEREWQRIETTVLYLGDFDPSGEDMHRSLIDRLARVGAHPDVPKIALTVEDARALPADFTKVGDSRAAAFVARYGDLAVELDALPAAELRRRITEAIEERMDMGALEATLDAEREQREETARKIGEAFGLDQAG
jgi:hypothetical protein